MRHLGQVPDDSGYRSFFDLLARPGTWSEDDRRIVELWLRQQRELLEGSNPKDTTHRAALSRLIEQIEFAVAQYDAPWNAHG